MSEVPLQKSAGPDAVARVARRKPELRSGSVAGNDDEKQAQKAMKMAAFADPNAALQKQDKQSNLHSNPDQSAGLQLLLALEADARECRSIDTLLASLANNPRRLLGYRQAFVLKPGLSGKFQVSEISSMAAVDRTSPLVRWVENLVTNLLRDNGGREGLDFQLPAFCDGDDEDTASYPFRNVLYVPLLDSDGDVQAIWLLMRDKIWLPGDLSVAERLAGTFAHALRALNGPKRSSKKKRSLISMLKWLTPVIVVAGGFIPIPLSTLAPVEVAAQNAIVIASPVDGIIGSIPVDPNAAVREGDIILQMNDTDLRNKFEVSSRDVEVAKAKLWRANQAAFSSVEAKRELATARAELRLREAERDAVATELERTTLRAQRDGVVIFKDKRDLIGKPVSIGERIMRLADPTKAEFRIELPVADAILLEKGTEVRVFLDVDPLNAIPAVLNRISYHAQSTADQTLAYRLSADPLEGQSADLRIGARGTAKLVGDDVPLYFYVLRKPIATVRQWTGF